MKQLIKNLLKKLSVQITFINEKNKLNALGINSTNSKVINNDLIKLTDLDLIIDQSKHGFVLDGYRTMLHLKNTINATFKIDPRGFLSIHIGDIKYQIQTREELFILNEIFIESVYNLITTKNFVFIDVGMNVAYSSIFFAEKNNCLKVYSFEPFKPTYSQALVNIGLNENIKDKIITHNWGLGNESRILSVTYDKDIKGNMGINGVPQYLQNQSTWVTEEIEIRNTSETLIPIIKKFDKKQIDIVIKIDCEGAEYEIFDSFKKSEILHYVDIIMLEWHFKGNEILCNILKEAGFSLFSFNHFNRSAGMIYAFNNRFEK